MVALLIKSEKEHLMKLTSLNPRVGKIKMNILSPYLLLGIACFVPYDIILI